MTDGTEDTEPNLKTRLENANTKADPVADGLLRRAIVGIQSMIDSPYTAPILIIIALLGLIGLAKCTIG